MSALCACRGRGAILDAGPQGREVCENPTVSQQIKCQWHDDSPMRADRNAVHLQCGGGLEVRIVLAASENDANFGSGTLGAATSRNKAEIQEQNSRASLRNHKCRGKCCSRDRHMRCISAAPAFGLVLFLMPVITACATSVPLEQAGLLSSYQHLAPSNGVLTQAQVSVNRDVILEAKTVRIIP